VKGADLEFSGLPQWMRAPADLRAAVRVIAATVPAVTLPHRTWLFWIGLMTMIAGSLLRRHCWRMLGGSFTGAVIVTPDQSVVERGAYATFAIRHTLPARSSSSESDSRFIPSLF
jgi:protein-S-isoprenylcysteine O-methyltransferase Ste14